MYAQCMHMSANCPVRLVLVSHTDPPINRPWQIFRAAALPAKRKPILMQVNLPAQFISGGNHWVLVCATQTKTFFLDSLLTYNEEAILWTTVRAPPLALGFTMVGAYQFPPASTDLSLACPRRVPNCESIPDVESYGYWHGQVLLSSHGRRRRD